jgi:hypothetical protein
LRNGCCNFEVITIFCAITFITHGTCSTSRFVPEATMHKCQGK